MFNPNGASGGTAPGDIPERPVNIYQKVFQAFPVIEP